MFYKYSGFTLLFFITGFAAIAFADDTELYVLESSVRSDDNPQILIILDTSGSMDKNGGEMLAPPFLTSATPTSTTKIYYSTSVDEVPLIGSQSYFTYDKNNCNSSLNIIKSFGIYTGYFRQYQDEKWAELPLTNDNIISSIDCYEDIAVADNKNASGKSNGYPVDGLSSAYSNDSNALANARLTDFGLGKPITLFTERYVNWYHNKPNNAWTTRMAVAKRVLSEVIVNTPGVDLGLMIFNKNSNGYDRHGGRVISNIKTGNITNKNSLLTTVNNTISIQSNSTPLCETLYEAARYLHAKSVVNGHKTSGSTDNPSYDTSAESPSGTYKSPFIGKECGSNASIILITDGAPQYDTNENGNIKNLLGLPSNTTDKDTPNSIYVDAYNYDKHYSLLPSVANWLANNDVNPYAPGVQTVKTYTIGFSEGVNNATKLLNSTAALGNGVAYYATDTSELQASLIDAIEAISLDSSSFSSPSVVLDKTQTGNSAYFAMFLPGEGPRWTGNLKKFKVNSTGDILDKNNNKAFSSDGRIAEDACSLWVSDASCADADYQGYDVNDGGVVAALRDNYRNSAGLANRNVLTNTGSSGSLVALTKNNARINGNLNDAELATFLNVDQNNIESTLNWAKGQNVDNEKYNLQTAPYLRQDILGDPLHSRPLVINYGTTASPDIRIIMGTNHGFVHMFKDTESEVNGQSVSTVSESWAFIPHELLPNIKSLRDNPKTGVHSVYGMDGSAVPYFEYDADGKINKAWVFMGMRRGGSSYYALDVTNKDAPTLLWIKNNSDYSLLGQSWSEPVVTKISGWKDSKGNAKPVLVVGAGYNPSTKDGASVGTNDTKGAGIYILDAATGIKVHSFGGSGVDTTMPGIIDSIPSKVAVLDSNNDQLTDRIYAADTGANVWRIDLPGLSTDSKNPWSAFKFANMGGNDTSTDIRFYSEPVIAQTAFSNVSEHTYTDIDGKSVTSKQYQSIPYDAVVIGSGHRANPLNKTRNDKFFVFQDRNIVSKSYSSAAGNSSPAALTISDLYDVTTESPTADEALITFGQKRGWYYSFADAGEKSLSAATIVEGKVFFTSYVPQTGATDNACLIPGEGRLRGRDLHKGGKIYSYSQDYFKMSEQVPDTPTLVIPKNGDDISYMYLIGIGDAANEMIKNDLMGDDGCADGDNKCVGGGLGVNQIYYHTKEN
ncbi:pilus assembly protein [Shewanella sp. MF05960]|uniref:pilus assembly protein n=1 Tax=Shewanella sp. MF05960 TaxID=3434874 RepID=UPI003D7A729A